MEVLRRMGEDREILKITRRMKMNWLGYAMRVEFLLKTAVEEKVRERKV